MPSFLPPDSPNLTLAARDLATPLVSSAAQGFTTEGALDSQWAVKVPPVWSALPANSRLYLYINAVNGEVGAARHAPIYQFGGAISTREGQFTFDYQAQIGWMGDGAGAGLAPLVFIGEAETSATGVVGTVA